jgi:hypothetical protein
MDIVINLLLNYISILYFNTLCIEYLICFYFIL